MILLLLSRFYFQNKWQILLDNKFEDDIDKFKTNISHPYPTTVLL